MFPILYRMIDVLDAVSYSKNSAHDPKLPVGKLVVTDDSNVRSVDGDVAPYIKKPTEGVQSRTSNLAELNAKVVPFVSCEPS